MLPLIGIGILVIGGFLFWTAVQNWLADVIARARTQLGGIAYALQSALVVLDRVIVNGKRVFIVTGRAVFRHTENAPEQESTAVREEVRELSREEMPTDVREKLERGEMLEYELSIASMKLVEKPKHVPHKLVVRRGE